MSEYSNRYWNRVKDDPEFKAKRKAYLEEYATRPGYKEKKFNYGKDWREKNPEKRILLNIKTRAKRIGLEFNLTLEDIVIPEICPILGIPLFFGTNTEKMNSPSCDRIDSSKGYIKGNVQFVSNRVNALKKNLTVQELERLLMYMKGEL